jgi:perosamine synthetase
MVAPMIPYGRQTIDESDIRAITDVLRSEYLTTGPKVEEFENSFKKYIGAKHAVAVSSGTAALHCAMYALGIGPGDEVILPPITFAATSNCICYLGATPIFVDVEKDTLLLDAKLVEKAINPKTKAIIGVDYAGHPCDWDTLKKIADKYGLCLVSDSCHALGAEYKNQKIGSIVDLTVFSFHPVKHITTGEGGMITTNSAEMDSKIRAFRNHGITTDHKQREEQGAWFYEMEHLGYNYRITDIQCALGINQLNKLDGFINRRRQIASFYDEAFEHQENIAPLVVKKNSKHSYHLYVIKISENSRNSRETVFEILRQRGIGVNVHYIPVHLHPYYRKKFNYHEGICPIAEEEYRRILSLPMWSGLSNTEIEFVANELSKATESL